MNTNTSAKEPTLEPAPDLLPAPLLVDPLAVQRDQEWSRRAEQLRDQEWNTAQELLDTASALLRRVRHRPGLDASLAEVSRMLDLASRLGRLATGLQTDKTEIAGKVDLSLRLQLESSLKRIYGPPAPPLPAPPAADQSPVPSHPSLPSDH